MSESFIHDQIEIITKQIEELKNRSHQYSSLRLLLTIAYVYCFFQGYFKSSYFLYGISAVTFLIFIIIVIKHGKVKNDLEDAQLLKESYEDILKRKNREWKSFQDTGIEFLKKEDTQAYDLDLFGKASLYQYLCVAKTPYGRNALAQALTWKQGNRKSIIENQKAIVEFENDCEGTIRFVQLLKSFEKHSHKQKKQKLDTVFEMLKQESKKQTMIEQIVSYALPCITWIGVIMMVFFHQSYLVFSVGFTLSLCLSLLFTMRNSEILASVHDLHHVIQDYERMFLHLHMQHYTSPYLINLQNKIHDGVQGTKDLHKILTIVSLHHNFIMNILLNGFFLMDFHGIHQFQKWQAAYGKKVEDWFVSIGEFERIASFTQLSFAKEKTVFPNVIESDKPTFSFTNMHHPLLLEVSAKSNSFQADSSSYIITGSNMSGKTTFLRTIGLNMILAQAGARVCAETGNLSCMQIYTSMRVQDDVSEGISTFYAEILRIKQMMDESKQKVPMLVLIDEIFKGTNSADRIECAIQAITRLHQPWIITMVSTHDFELCDLEYDSAIQAHNYHFSEYYEDDKICFDYQLKDGRCQTTNAKQLMKLAGFFD